MTKAQSCVRAFVHHYKQIKMKNDPYLMNLKLPPLFVLTR